jgi:hypothetical protein
MCKVVVGHNHTSIGDDSTIQKPMTYVCITIIFHEKQFYGMQHLHARPCKSYLNSHCNICINVYLTHIKHWVQFNIICI